MYKALKVIALAVIKFVILTIVLSAAFSLLLIYVFFLCYGLTEFILGFALDIRISAFLCKSMIIAIIGVCTGTALFGANQLFHTLTNNRDE